MPVDVARHAAAVAGPTPAGLLRWIIDERPERGEHAVCPDGPDHTLCGRSVDWLLHGSDVNPRSVRATRRPSWPPSRRCVECCRRLVTRLVVADRHPRADDDDYRHVCAVYRYSIPKDQRRPMAGVRSDWVRAVLAGGREAVA